VRKVVAFTIAILYLVSAVHGHVHAAPSAQQEQNVCLISSPANGAQLRGRVTIMGSASHPSFSWYQVGYALDPSPDGKWTFFFNSDQAVSSGRIVVWDTTTIPDGVYQLILEVHRKDSGLDMCFSKQLRVNNSAPTPTFTAEPLPTAVDTPTALPAAEDTPTVAVEQPPTATPRPTPTYSAVDNPTPTPEMTRFRLPIDPASVRGASCRGAQLAILIVVVATIYFVIRNLTVSGVRKVWKPKDVEGFHQRRPRRY
jgi:hypothetical protein